MYLHSPVRKNLFVLFPIGSSNNFDIAASICHDTRFIKAQHKMLHQLSKCIASLFALPPILPLQVIEHNRGKAITAPLLLVLNSSLFRRRRLHLQIIPLDFFHLRKL